jgi:Flp pilus assembly protein TadG
MMRMWFRNACGTLTPEGRKRRALRGEEGTELVEFALSAWLLFILVFGLVELCLVLFSYNTAAEAARNTARWLSVQGANVYAGTVTSADITTHVQAIPGAAQMTPTVNWCTNSTTCSATPTSANTAAGSLVQVQVQYVFASVPFISKSSLTATSTSQMVIWQ